MLENWDSKFQIADCRSNCDRVKHFIMAYYILQGIYEKGTKDEIEEFIYHLVDVSGDGILGR